jgi:hypothetical protein
MFRSKPRLAVLAAALVVLAAPAAPAASLDPDLRRVRIRSGEDATAVLVALQGAQRKLQDSACQQLLEDFQDAEGRSLRDNLAPFGLEPADYLTLLVFADGGEQQRGALCRVRGVAAVTVPKGRVVYICGSAFREMSLPHREHALIHEMLHSLGLGENPPSAREINAQVWRRCGG